MNFEEEAADGGDGGNDVSEEDDDESSDGAAVDPYDEDGYGDEADRAYLYGLPELEREAILTERYSERQRRLEAKQARRELREARRAGGSKRARRVKGASARQAESGQASALSDMKRKRSREQAARKERRDADAKLAGQSLKARYKQHRVDYGSDEEEARLSAADRQREKQEALAAKARAYNVPLAEFLPAQVLRPQIEAWIGEPFLAEALVGAYVRVGIGIDQNQERVYRMARVCEVVDGPRRYELVSQRRKKTNVLLRLAVGKKKRDFKVIEISGQPIQEAEWVAWRRVTARYVPGELPSSKKLAERARILREKAHHVHTEEEVQQMIERNRKTSTLRNFAVEKTALQAKLDDALTHGDQTRVSQLRRELSQLQEDQKSDRERRVRDSATVSNINIKNRSSNAVRSQSVARDEMKALKSDDNKFDPFQRRKTAPKVIVASSFKLDEASAADGSAGDAGAKEGDGARASQDRTEGEADGDTAAEAAALSLKLANSFSVDIDVPVDEIMAAVESNQLMTGTSSLPKTPHRRLPLVTPVASPLPNTPGTTAAAKPAKGSRVKLSDYLKKKVLSK